ncbi:MAG TPA: 30S ribosomal protein S6 [Mycobacteriales bacterium]|jgi:small subunit ribosomal protein S6|nr:30S ribosomal protein S6 [Mycobacteriales bacterium]
MSLRHYEVMVILDPELESSTIEPSLKSFLTVIDESSGAVDSIDIWGRRRMAYEINKKYEGIYAVMQLSAAPAAVSELDRQLKLNESVIRTKVIRPDQR